MIFHVKYSGIMRPLIRGPNLFVWTRLFWKKYLEQPARAADNILINSNKYTDINSIKL